MTDERDRPPAEPLEPVSGLNLNDRVPQVIHYELKWDSPPHRSPKTPPPVASLNKK